MVGYRSKAESTLGGHLEVTTDAIPDMLTEEQTKTNCFLVNVICQERMREELLSLLVEYHDVFSLKDGERGETN